LRILLTGKNGQLGWELQRCLAALGPVAALSRAELDLSAPDTIGARIREVRPDLIVNAAAYTAVDRAESEPDLAMAINGTAPGILAEEAKRLGILLLHYSTDYVFEGKKSIPYSEEDVPNPINVYGVTKLAGERAIQATGCRHLIFRTSWVYSTRGTNFLLTIQRLAEERRLIRVVDDQHGAPTWAYDIAAGTRRVLERGDTSPGLYHMTASGETTWCGFAKAIVSAAGLSTEIVPIASSQYPTAARRPLNSLLSNDKLSKDYGFQLDTWRKGLARCLARLGEAGAVHK
jgi:dTDP-4-dehydrorhamnose reductase